MKHNSTTRRDGAVLLVVLAMLALFAVIGLSFVFYAESRATSARIYREAQELPADSPDPQHLMAFSQLIYGTTDGPSGVFSMLRGHDLARLMYGYSYEGADPENPIIGTTTNSVAYGGVGPVPATAMAPYPAARITPLLNYQWQYNAATPLPVIDPEHTGTRALPNTPIVPGNTRYIGKNESVTYPSNNDVAVALVNPVNGNVLVPSFYRPWAFNGGAYTGANEYLKQRALAPPSPLVPVGSKPLAADGNGDDWTNRPGQYRITRPRPSDHGGFFPYPPPNADNTYTGDVQNLPGAAYPFLNSDGTVRADAAGNPILIPKNDSIWLDIGAPVQVWNGRRVKPLFAFLVVPTNNRVNINSAGNLKRLVSAGPPAIYEHDSGMGLFPSEVNPKYIIRQTGQFANEYNRIKTAQYGANYSATAFPTVAAANQPNPPAYNATTPGRVTTLTVPPPGGYVPPASAAMDWDGTGMANAMRMLLPGQIATNIGATHSAFATSPRFIGPAGFNRFGNGDVGDLPSATAPAEQLLHPYFWNPYLHRPRTNSVGGLDGSLTFTEADLRKLHAKWADDTGLTNDTLFGNLAPISLGSVKGIGATGPGKSPANRDRFNLTTRSSGLALHNLMPMTVNYAGSMTPYQWAAGQPMPIGLVPSTLDPTNPMYGSQPLAGAAAVTTDFDLSATGQTKMRAGVGALPALDLNRPLTDYRHPLAIKYNLPLRPDNVIMPSPLVPGQLNQWYTQNGITPALIASTPGLPDATIMSNYWVGGVTATTNLFNAMRDRQELAKDIFARLVVATGASATYMKWNGYCQPSTGITPDQFDALRYLAQLAANIVDYIDGDDVATTFVWNPGNPQVTSNFSPDITILNGLISDTGLAAPADRNFNASQIPLRVVMGTEKPKLTINEAYCELANNPADTGGRANNQLELRFLLELINPSANDALNGNETKPFHTIAPDSFRTNPMANADLFYGPNQQVPNDFNPAVNPYSAYVVDLHVAGQAAIRDFYDPTATDPQIRAVRGNVLATTTAPASRRIDFAALAMSSMVPGSPAGYAGPASRANPRLTALMPEANAGPVAISPQFVGPVGTKYTPIAGANYVSQGYLVLAPGSIPNSSVEFVPAAWDQMGMTYTLPPSPVNYDSAVMVPLDPVLPTQGLSVPFGPTTPPDDPQIPIFVAQAQAGRPAVMVRRLANPYLPPNDPASTTAVYNPLLAPNPYLMTDLMSDLHVNDAVRVGRPAMGNSTRPTTNPPQRHTHFTKGKGHPLAAHAQLAHNTVADPALPPPAMGDMPLTTFFRHNGTPTVDPESPLAPLPTATNPTAQRNSIVAGVNNLLLTPQSSVPGGRLGFEWMTFLDRPLVNQLELLNVPAVPPHLLTLTFASGDLSQPNPATPPLSYRFHNHTAAWTDTSLNLFPPQPNLANQSRLYRALELLRVKPWSYAMPNGGRVPGKINVNLITDPNVLKALADPQNGDFFRENSGPAAIDPATGQPLDVLFDVVNPYDPANSATNMASTFARLQTLRGNAIDRLTGVPIANSIVTSNQYDPATNTTARIQVPGPNDRPFHSLGNAANASGYFPAGKAGLADTPLNGVFDLPAQTHPYNKTSLLRKIHNNLTTTSEVFEVYLTVGFFDVLNSGPYYSAPNWTIPQLGKEVFRDVPGDTRHKYFAVVDRTNLSLDPASAVLVGTQYSTRRQGAKPVFTDVVNLSAPVAGGLNGKYASNLQFHASAGFVGQGVTIRYDQTPDETNDFPIVVGSRLKIGTGSDAEWVQVTGVTGLVGAGGTLFDTNTGIATVTVTRNIGLPVSPTAVTGPYIERPLSWTLEPLGAPEPNRPELPTHPPGTAICNVPLGNPGPQPAFDPTQPNYKAVMPYLIKLEQ